MKTLSLTSFSRKRAGERGLSIALFTCGVLFLALVPLRVFAWGAATHAYFAGELGQGRLNSQEIYGATAPDLFNLMLGSGDYDYLVNQTHDRFSKVKTKARRMGLETFAFGFVTHNEVWGADHTAHEKGRTTRGGYIITKSKELAPKLKPELEEFLEDAGVANAFLLVGPMASQLAEPLIETAVDLLIKRSEDPAIGPRLSQSARERSPGVPDLLVAAYARDFARHTKKSEEEAETIIREAETAFRNLMIRYGEILTREEGKAIEELAGQGSDLVNTFLKSATGKDLNLPPEILAGFITLAISEVEGDYGQEIAETLSYLRRRGTLLIYLRSLLKKDFKTAYEK